MASQSAAALRKAIRDYLSANEGSPIAGELQKVDRALGSDSGPAPDSPGHRAAMDAAGGPPAKPNTPGADMNNAQPPGQSGGGSPFQGIKRADTAKKLARLRFKSASGGGRH